MQQEYSVENDEIEIDLLKIIKTVWKKLWLIVLVAALLGGGMFVYKKYTYVPRYETAVTMYCRLNNQEEAPEVGVDKLTGTCIAVLMTRTTLDKVADSVNLDITYDEIRSMVFAYGIPNSPLFEIAVSGTDPEEIALIANTAADILPEMVHSVYGECEVGVVDYALAPDAAQNSDGAAKDAVVAAALGAMLVCGIIAVKVIYTDWADARKNRK